MVCVLRQLSALKVIIIRHIKKKANGTRELATRIADWVNVGTVIKELSFQPSIPIGIDNIDINNSNFDKYRHDFLKILGNCIQNENDIALFLRYKDAFVTYHTVLYDLPFNCLSYIISYKTVDSSIEYGRIIIFFKINQDYYGFVQKYISTKKA